MEQEWLAALKEVPPQHVEVSIEPIYKDDSLRPDKLVVEYKMGGNSNNVKLLKINLEVKDKWKN